MSEDIAMDQATPPYAMLGSIQNALRPEDMAAARAHQEQMAREAEARWAREQEQERAERASASAQQRRMAALEAALRIHAGTGETRFVLEAAKAFDAFLTGVSDQ